MMDDGHALSRRLLLIGVLVLKVVILVAVARSAAPEESPQRSGDVEAVKTASFLVPGITDAIADLPESERASAAETWLLEPDSAYLFPDTHWTVGARQGSRIPVVFYFWWQDKSFGQPFWGGPYWGRSCDVFTIEATEVTSSAVTCPENTPEIPTGARTVDP